MRHLIHIISLVLFTSACSSPEEPPRDVPDVATLDAGAAEDLTEDSGASTDLASNDAGNDDPLRDPTCTTAGCLRVARHVGDFGRSALEPFLEPGVQIENGYSVWVIEYVTHFDGELRTSTGTVALPYEALPPPGGFHIVANAHGTVGIDDPCKLAGTVYGSGLAGLFAGRGMIGVATDYIGLGTAGLHPYLIREAEAASVLDSLRAAQNLAQGLDVSISDRFAVVGLSQGGHATLSAAAAHAELAPDLDIRAFAASGPASAWLEHFTAGAAFDGPHLIFHALLLYAWTETLGYSGPSIWAEPFGQEVKDALEKRCIFDFGGVRETFDEVVPTAADEIFDATFLAAYRAGDLSSYPVMDQAFADNRIAPFEQTAPIAIWQGDLDDIVLEVDTRQMVEALRAGGVEIDYRRVPNAGHIDLAFGYVAQAQLRTEESIAWVREQLNR